MIFVTVGTHEQQFNRLIEAVDQLKKENIILDKVFMQIGYSTYKPEYCDYKTFLSYEEMEDKIKKAKLVISHGGPATYMNVLLNKKKLIVVPRLRLFKEHVNDHQLEFLKKISVVYNINYVENINHLPSYLEKCEKINIKCNEKDFLNNVKFNKRLKELIL